MQTLHDANDTFVHLLQTFAVLMSERPDDAELDDKLACQCNEELRTLRSVQKALERRISLVSQRRNTFPRINALPPELLVNIIAIVIDDGGSGSIRSDHATLSLVCQHWNHLVDTTPSLWSKIDLGTISMTKITRALEKSRNAPLDIIYTSSIFEPIKQYAFLDVILPHAHRWREVHLMVGDANRTITGIASLSMPLLEDLHLSMGGWDGENPVDLFGGRPPPRLQKLCLWGIPVLWSPTILCHLTMLSISQIDRLGPSLDQFMAVLSACPDLESLSISDVSFSSGVSTFSPNPIHMLALETLELRTLTTEITNRLLASIHAPNCISGALNCDVRDDPLETLFTSDIGHFLDHFRSNPGSSSITCGATQFKIDWMGPWIIKLTLKNINFAKDTLIWLAGPTPIPPLRMTINEVDLYRAPILPVVADMESLYRIVLGYEFPVSNALTLLASCSLVQGSTRWPFPALVEMSIESGIGNVDWEGLLLMLRRRQGVSEIQDHAQHPKPLRILEFGSNWSAGSDNSVIADFSSTYWPNRLDEVRKLLGPEGELRWYGRIVTEEGVLADRVWIGWG